MKRTTTGGESRNRQGVAANITAFLAAYERCGMIKPAARAAGITHANHFNWLARVPGYAGRFAEVHNRTVAALAPVAEAELVNRAIDGVRTLVIDRGVPVEVWVNPDGEIVPAPKDPEKPGNLTKTLYWEVRKSDALLIKLLQKLNPEYAEKQKIDHTSGGKPIKFIGGVDENAL